ncbi:hypothetical protein NZK35_06310 [Stieleria sp. ICT_E10.1]|uniref:hypothetical protein n=1 Tax=Stieleria sedimenti TaxID=2976331 RepID=UPI002180478C|nr:hypothetical protein [Stieleria sedimenti]MCS7466287.1 hypothetical protein [Stieleria sedimenti]
MEDQTVVEQSECGIRCRVIGEVLENVSVVVTPEIWERYFEPFAETKQQLVLLAMKFLPFVDQLEDDGAKESKFPFVAELNDATGAGRVWVSLQISSRTNTSGEVVFLIEQGGAPTQTVEAGACHGPA